MKKRHDSLRWDCATLVIYLIVMFVNVIIVCGSTGATQIIFAIFELFVIIRLYQILTKPIMGYIKVKDIIGTPVLDDSCEVYSLNMDKKNYEELKRKATVISLTDDEKAKVKFYELDKANYLSSRR